MTNIERWVLWNRDSFSPDLFVEWGFLSLISSALQRRVWYSSEVYPQYPNMYILLIGPAGCGKGLMLDQVKEHLIYHKKSTRMNPVQRAAIRATRGAEADIPEYLFPIAADSTTFESLTQEMVNATEIFLVPGSADGYAHASLTFILDEFTSIFKKFADDTVTFLLTAWNCKDYLRRTKRSGVDPIKNQCMNLLAGTTPTELAKVMRADIIGSGFASRLVIVYAAKNRGREIKIPPPDEAQLAARQDIRNWLLILSKVYGRVTYSAAASDYLSAWWKDEAKVRVNPAQKLDEYYVRKLNHVHKAIMAMHYSDPGFEREVPVETIIRAIDLFARTEVNMHVALQGGGRNPLGPVTKSVGMYVRANPGTGFQELLIQFVDEANAEELGEVIKVLQAQGVVTYDHSKCLYYPSKK